MAKVRRLEQRGAGKRAPGHAGTFRGNQLAMAAGYATLRFIRREGICSHVGNIGARLQTLLQGLQAEFDWVGDVRGRGLMLGMEIIDPAGQDGLDQPAADGEKARRLQRACLKRGLLVELGGRPGATVRLLPSLIITEAEVDLVGTIVYQAAQTVQKEPVAHQPWCVRQNEHWRQPPGDSWARLGRLLRPSRHRRFSPDARH